LLPAGAVAGWDLHPLESAAFSRRTPVADLTDSTVRASNASVDMPEPNAFTWPKIAFSAIRFSVVSYCLERTTFFLTKMASPSPPNRVYDKGERRFKHVGKGHEPIIEFDNREPKKWIGKCPSTLSESAQKRLLDEAIAAPNGDRELDAPKKLYVVHEGAIYEAQTSDRGRTYHGYPYKGRLSDNIHERLRTMASEKVCLELFDAWVKKHIEIHGSRK
jgi:hypothetical protein